MLLDSEQLFKTFIMRKLIIYTQSERNIYLAARKQLYILAERELNSTERENFFRYGG